MKREKDIAQELDASKQELNKVKKGLRNIKFFLIDRIFHISYFIFFESATTGHYHKTSFCYSTVCIHRGHRKKKQKMVEGSRYTIREGNFQNWFTSLLKRAHSKRCEFATFRSELFPFKVKPSSESPSCIGKQRGSHKS